jgi:hypothetical protein
MCTGRSAGILVAAILIAAGGRTRAASAPPPPPIRSDWHLRYQPLESASARELLDRAMAFGKKRLGEPAIPVKEVRLRLSAPLEEGDRIRRGFQLTEIADSEKGIFAIYVSARPGEVAFPGQLAHEAFHLANARLRDAYVEGLNGLLTEEFLRDAGMSWEPWKRHFESGKEPLYGQAYALAVDLAAAAGREAVWTMLRFAVETPANRERMEIDIDGWLRSLPEGARARAKAAIEARHEAIEILRRRDQPELAFRRPR